MRIRGAWYTGRDAGRREVVARLGADGMIAFEPEVSEPVRLADVELSARIGGVPRLLTLPDGSQFETADHDRLDRWLAAHGRGAGWVHRLEGSYRFAAIAVVAVALAVFVAARWGIPALSRHIAYALPAEVHAKIGAGTLEELDERVFEPSGLPAERREALRAAFQRYAPEDDGLDYRLVFRDGGWIGANAFALPDGTVVLTDALVELARDDAEVLAVLFHEIGHVAHRHSMRLVVAHSGLAMLSLLIVGDVNAAGALVLALPSVLVESSYSRDLETEADDFALALMLEQGFDPVHFANLMARLEACATHAAGDGAAADPATCEAQAAEQGDGRTGWLRYVASHPASSERIERFRSAR